MFSFLLSNYINRGIRKEFMDNINKSIDELINSLRKFKDDLENYYIENEFELDKKIDMIISMRENNFSVDEISNLSGLSIREVVDILDL